MSNSHFIAIPRRAVIVCRFHPSTGSNDNRIGVTIRDFPRRYFDCSIAENIGINGPDQLQYFAGLRVEELKLDWEIKAAGTLPTGEAIFTV
jgi:hypothetical protein